MTNWKIICFPNQNNMQRNMQQPHVILCCYANWQTFVAWTTTSTHRLNIEICNIFEIEILRNTKLGVTPRCPSHRCLLRRGTPLTRSWFMPALNTQRFATVLTHASTCFSHAEYHYCVTVYQSDLKSEIQSFARKIQNLLGLLCSP